MAGYEVTLQDGRTLRVNSDSRDQVEKQASHQERTRIAIATKRGMDDLGPDPSSPVKVKKVKD